MTKGELEVAVAFARLELLELDHGRRALTACPGILNVAAAIRQANHGRRCEWSQPQGDPGPSICGFYRCTHCGGTVS
jgi:hypothetical protein